MKKLLKFMKKYIAECITAPIFKLLEVCFELIVPIVVASIIDSGIAMGDKPHILKMCGILALLAVVGLSCAILAQYFAAKASVGFSAEIRYALFKHIGSLSYSQLDEMGSSTLITRLTGDVNQVQTGANLTLRLLLRSPFVVFGAMFSAFAVDARAATVFVVTIPVLAVVIFAVMLLSIPMYKKVQSALDNVLHKTNENLQGVRVVRAFCKEEKEIEDFKLKNSALNSMQTAVGKISAIMNPATIVIINFAVVALIYVGALQVKSGSLSQGQVVALYNYMSQILVELIKLANLIINITRSIACGNRIQAVLDTDSLETDGEITELNKDYEYAVEFNNVSLKYSRDADSALSGIDFKIKRGETVGVLGSTGSGKTSLINLIPLFYTPSEGEVCVCGNRAENYNLKALRKSIGLVPQKAVLFKGSIRDNMLFSVPDATDEEINTALETAQAIEFVSKKDGGLDFEIEQDGKNLSGGQKQRLTIARALLRRPEILILDDSSSALDYATDAKLRKALKESNCAQTVIVVSQRASSVRFADRIIVLDNGKIVGIGSEEQLLESCETYREIWNTQFGQEAAL